MEVVTVVEKLASSPRAAASSFNVSRAPGALSIRLLTAVSTYPFVAASAVKVGVPRPVILLVPIAIAPDMVPPLRFSFNASAVSTYPLVAASPLLVGDVRLVMVAAVPASIFKPPLMVTSLNEEVPLEAVTLPVRSPVTLPTTAPVCVPAVLPVTAPVRPPTKPVLAVIVVPVIA